MTYELIALFEMVKAQKFRVRKVSDLTDYCILGIHEFVGMHAPRTFTVYDFQKKAYSETPALAGGYVLLSTANEIKAFRGQSEHEVITTLKASYKIN
jgi:hypothetical protein